MQYNLAIAIGDLHGEYSALEKILNSINKKYSILDNGAIRKDTAIISLGDSIDRGDQALKILDFFMDLKEKNPDNFFPLIGNHELMALEFLDFIPELQKRKEKKIDYYSECDHGFNGGVKFLREFGATEDEALERYSKRMSDIGDIGNFFRDLLPKFELNSFGKKILFVHAGIPPTVSKMSEIEDYANRYKVYIHDKQLDQKGSREKYDSHFIVAEGFFWDRSIENRTEEYRQRLVKDLGINFMVIGHTPHKDIEIYSKKIINIDVGMSKFFGANTPAALIISKDGIVGHYADKEEKMLISF